LWVAAFVVHQVRAVTTKIGNGQSDVSGTPVVTPFRISAPTDNEVDDEPDRSHFQASD